MESAVKHSEVSFEPAKKVMASPFLPVKLTKTEKAKKEADAEWINNELAKLKQDPASRESSRQFEAWT